MHRFGRRVFNVLGIAITTLVLAPVIAHGDGNTYNQPAGKAEDPDYTAAMRAIRANDFKSAISLLQTVIARDPKNADAYNNLGYATRKNGDAAGAIPIYQKALALDAKHRGAHEYIGEAYLMAGNLVRAEHHLRLLEGLCQSPCEERDDLAKAIREYKARAQR